MPYLTIGDPDFEATADFAVAMIDAGADIMELGIPFSDPTADGPIIQAAMVRALEHPDFSLEKVFNTTKAIAERRPDTPLVFLTYLNPVLTGFLGPQKDLSQKALSEFRESFNAAENIHVFLRECNSAGISGIVIPDLPYDQPESEIFRDSAKKYDISRILMITPNTAPKRFKEICKFSEGFIYYVTSLGVTGERTEFPPELRSNIEKIKKTNDENRKFNITPPKIKVGLEKRFLEAMPYTRNILNALPARARKGR